MNDLMELIIDLLHSCPIILKTVFVWLLRIDPWSISKSTMKADLMLLLHQEADLQIFAWFFFISLSTSNPVGSVLEGILLVGFKGKRRFAPVAPGSCRG